MKRPKHYLCRSESRTMKTATVLEKRQPTLTLVLENINDPHNLSAVLRSCDATGVLEVYTIYNNGQPFPKLTAKKSSASADKWIKINNFSSVEECYAALRGEGKKIYTTHLSRESKPIYELNLTEPVALVLGNEHLGVSEEAVNLADGNYLIPQVGMIQSLNISVAAAVSLYEAFRQRQVAGMYQERQLSDESYDRLYHEWISK